MGTSAMAPAAPATTKSTSAALVLTATVDVAGGIALAPPPRPLLPWVAPAGASEWSSKTRVSKWLKVALFVSIAKTWLPSGGHFLFLIRVLTFLI